MNDNEVELLRAEVQRLKDVEEIHPRR